MFFYVSRDARQEVESGEHRGSDGFGAEWIDYILGTYGIHRFLADLDEGRGFSEPGIVAETLRYISRDGFADLAERHEIPFHSAREFRERFILEALRGPGL